jgi:septum formation protein
MTLYLASASPRRAQLIQLLGIPNVIISPTHIDETHDGNLAPAEYVEELAIGKAKALLPSLKGDEQGVILGADTTVVLDNAILGKPNDADHAKKMLRRLSGNTHIVYTGVALVDSASGKEHSFVEKTFVTFREISDEEIAMYVASGSPMDKAGSYGIQEDHGAVFVSRIDGDYYNVVGLPLCSLYLALREFSPTIFVS